MKYSRNHHQYHHYHRVVRRNRNYGRLVQPMRYYDDQQQPAEFQFQAIQPNFNYLSDDTDEPPTHHRRHIHEPYPIHRVRRAAITKENSAIIAADIVNPNRRNGHKRRLKLMQK